MLTQSDLEDLIYLIESHSLYDKNQKRKNHMPYIQVKKRLMVMLMVTLMIQN